MQEINPKETTRAYAFEMWMKAPIPMVTLIKTLDVSRLRRISRKRGLKFNMGTVSTELVQDVLDGIVSVSPHTDGRRPRCQIP